MANSHRNLPSSRGPLPMGDILAACTSFLRTSCKMMTDVTKRYLVPEGEKEGGKVKPTLRSSLSLSCREGNYPSLLPPSVVGPQDVKLRQFQQEDNGPVLGES